VGGWALSAVALPHYLFRRKNTPFLLLGS
jgi:hypothetical protein